MEVLPLFVIVIVVVFTFEVSCIILQYLVETCSFLQNHVESCINLQTLAVS